MKYGKDCHWVFKQSFDYDIQFSHVQSTWTVKDTIGTLLVDFKMTKIVIFRK